MKSEWQVYPSINLYGTDGSLVSQYAGSSYYASILTKLPETGRYTLLVGDNDGYDTGNYSICITRVPFPVYGYAGIPTDPDADCIYEDLNANGRLDFADVVLYFNQMQWIAVNEPIEAFDLNRNGRIDFADIVKLFNEVGT
jgi:PKD repeat protein